MTDRIEKVARAICEAVDMMPPDMVEFHGLHDDGRYKRGPRWHRHINQARIQIAAFDTLREMESPTPD